MLYQHSFLIGEDHNYIYVTQHGAMNDRHAWQIIVCAPEGKEWANAYPVLVLLARELGGKNCIIYRFDYTGTGDSAGASGTAGWDDWLLGIRYLINHIHMQHPDSRMLLMGVRMGGLLALSTAGMTGVTALFLVDPVLDTRKYLKELMMMEQVYSGRSKAENIYAFGGFLYSRELISFFENFRLDPFIFKKVPDIQMLFSNRGMMGFRHIRELTGSDFWDQHAELMPDMEPFWNKPSFTRSYSLEHKLRTMLV